MSAATVQGDATAGRAPGPRASTEEGAARPASPAKEPGRLGRPPRATPAAPRAGAGRSRGRSRGPTAALLTPCTPAGRAPRSKGPGCGGKGGPGHSASAADGHCWRKGTLGCGQPRTQCPPGFSSCTSHYPVHASSDPRTPSGEEASAHPCCPALPIFSASEMQDADQVQEDTKGRSCSDQARVPAHSPHGEGGVQSEMDITLLDCSISSCL